jgi:two-component system, NarL family, nitrate/nitrite response regulator NarL
VPLRCLIVDDNHEFVVSASTLLSSQGLEIVGTASTGPDAIRQAESVRPDVVLVDVQLGEEDGLEVARQLDERMPGAAVILISTHSREDVTELAADSPVAGFLPKTALSAEAIASLVD